MILDSLAARALRFQQDNKLGIYKKAKLGNTFRWRLKELGYSDAFIDRATQHIVTHIAGGARAAKAGSTPS